MIKPGFNVMVTMKERIKLAQFCFILFIFLLKKKASHQKESQNTLKAQVLSLRHAAVT